MKELHEKYKEALKYGAEDARKLQKEYKVDISELSETTLHLYLKIIDTIKYNCKLGRNSMTYTLPRFMLPEIKKLLMQKGFQFIETGHLESSVVKGTDIIVYW